MLVEKLSQTDNRIIFDWISTYSISNREYSSFSPSRMAPLSHILRGWDNAKQAHLWKMFGEQFILEKEVSYARPENLLHRDLSNSLSYGEMREFKNELFNRCERYFNYWSEDHHNIRQLFDTEYLKENLYIGRSYTIVFDEKNKISVSRGTKVMKVLNKFAKFFKIEDKFEKFRIAHSQILNQKVLNGTLCISIHPFDYMTLSDNTYDWDSCMSWENNGCYRAGTVEMMNSPYVVVAYLKGDKPFRVAADLWPGNKKWRELYVVHPNSICNIKGYPYMNTTLSTIVLEWLRELAVQNLGWNMPYEPQEFEADRCFDYADGRTYRFDFETNYMYNDFNTDNTCHKIIVSQGWQPADTDYIYESINISGPNICVCCGSFYDIDEGHEDQVLCDDCDPGLRCSCCGEDWDEDEMRYVDGRPLCPDCFYDCAGECAISEDYYYNDELITVYLTAVKDNLTLFDELRSATIHRRYAEADGLHHCDYYVNISELRRIEVDGETIFYLNMEDCTTCGLEQLFQLWHSRFKEQYIEQYLRMLEE